MLEVFFTFSAASGGLSPGASSPSSSPRTMARVDFFYYLMERDGKNMEEA
jgi:hypothetical protein